MLLFGSAIASAQIGTGVISGTVTDQSKSVVAGAAISITHTATGTMYSATTDNAGRYIVINLPVGDFRATAEAPGFKRTVRDGITLQVDEHAEINFPLDVGGTTESVIVTDVASLVDTSSATIGKVVDNTRMVELPINGRNGLSLLELTPNVRSQSAEQSGFADRGTAISAVTINGGVSGANMIVLDGTSNIQPRQGDSNVNMTADAIQEFKVESGVVSAEYNYTLGGVINMVTKSGTNSIHGTLYEFLRNVDLDARNFFAATKAPYRYNQFGGSVGGPIKKNKLFYFANVEHYIFDNSYFVIGTVPTPAERLGDFSNLRTASGALTAVYNPTAVAPNPSGSGYVSMPFQNNIIPPSMLDKVAVNIVPFYPLPNVTASNAYTQANNFESNNSTFISGLQEVGKIDYTISDKDTLSGRYILTNQKNDNGSQGNGIFPDALSRVRHDNYTARNASIAETHVFASNLINEFHLGVVRNAEPFGLPSLGAGYPEKLGLPITGPSAVPNVTLPDISLSSSNGVPGWPAGFASFSGFIGMLTEQVKDNVTWIKGKHTLKLGFEFMDNQYNNNSCQYCSGEFFFNSTVTGNPQALSGTGNGFASFLLGAVANASIQDNSGTSLVNFMQGYYAQDEWKIARHLTLTLGLRWDYQQVPGERNNGLSNFNPTAIDPVNGLKGELQYAGPAPGFGRAELMPDYKNWSPRFGFAWDVLGNSKLVLRGGYGIYYAYTMSFADNFGALGYKNNTTTWGAPGGNTTFPAFQLQNGFPTPVVPPIGNQLGPAAFLGSTVTYDEPWGRTPYSQQFALSAQYQLPKGILLDTAYSGNKGTHLRDFGVNLDQLNPQYLSLGNALLNQVPNPYAGIVPGSLGGAKISMEQSLLAYPYYNAITDENSHQGSSIYHSLIVTGEKRMSSGLVVLLSYTYGKSISSGVSTPQEAGTVAVNSTTYQNGLYNLAAERAVDSYNTPQRFVTSLVYELPFGNGKPWKPSNPVLNTLASGWQLSTVSSFEAGFPLAITGANNNIATRPNSTGVSAQLSDPTVQEWFNTLAFVNPPNWTYGNVSRTINVYGPGVMEIDMSASKITQIKERFKLQLRGEFFNIPNHANFLSPNTTFVPGTNGLNSSSTFGTITSARDPRIIQIAAKLIF
jgi:outer membrane receptor protein involved in Fe transport